MESATHAETQNELGGRTSAGTAGAGKNCLRGSRPNHNRQHRCRSESNHTKTFREAVFDET